MLVGVDGFAYGKTGSYCCRKVMGFVCGAVCHFVVEQVFSDGFEEAMRGYAWAILEAEYLFF